MTRKIIVTDSPYPSYFPNGTVMTVTHEYAKGEVNATVDGGDGFAWHIGVGEFKEYTPDTPVLWEDMTPEQKGALLLAHHEGDVIEWNTTPYRERLWEKCPKHCLWDDNFMYRIKPSKPEPKVEAVVLHTGQSFTSAGRERRLPNQMGHDTHRITFSLIDGKPDCDSVKMEEL